MNTQNSHIVINWEGYRQWHFANGNAWSIPENKDDLSVLEQPHMIEGQLMWRIGVGNLTMAIPDKFVGFRQTSKGVVWKNFNLVTGDIKELDLFSVTYKDIENTYDKYHSDIKMFKSVRAGSDLSHASEDFIINQINAAVDILEKLDSIRELLQLHNKLVANGYLVNVSGFIKLQDFNPVTGNIHSVDLDSFTLEDINNLIKEYQSFSNSGIQAGSNAAPGAAGFNTIFFNNFSKHMGKALHNLHDLCEKKMLSLGMTI